MAELSLVFDLLARDRASSKVKDVGDAMGKAGDDAEGLGDRVKGMFGKIAGAAAGAGLAVGASFADALNIEAANDKLAAQMGAPAEMAAELGAVAGNLYAGAYGDSLETVNEAVRGVIQQGAVMEDASTGQIEAVTAKVLDLATAFDQDLGATTNAVGQMIRTGLAADADEALDIITRGMQQGADASGDLLDTFVEYPALFQRLGLDGATAMGLIEQGMGAGARNADLVADALKEFQIRSTDASETSADAFQAIGMNAERMTAIFAEGGPEAADALSNVLQGLRDIEDPVARNAAAVGLFGTQAEDLGAALFALDPSTAVGALGEIGGAAERMGETLNDNGQVQLESFIRGIRTGLAGLATSAVTGAQDLIAGVRTGVETGDWSAMGSAVETAIGTVLDNLPGMAQKLFDFVSGMIASVDWFGLAMRLGEQVPTLLTGLALGILNFDLGSLLSGLANNWFAVLTGVLALAFAPGKLVAKVGELLGRIPLVGRFLSWLLGGAKSLVDGAVRLVGQVIGGFARGFIGGTGQVVGAVKGTFNLVKTVIVAWGGDVIAWFGRLPARFVAQAERIGAGLRGAFNSAARAMGSAISSGANAALDVVRGLPGRITSGLGNLGSLLVGAGGDLLRGMINGIRNVAGNVAEAAKDAARAAVNGVKSFLGISSPSKVFMQLGEYIGQGLVKGLTGTAKDVAAASRKLGDLLVKAHQDALKRGDLAGMRTTAEAYHVLLTGNDRLIDVAKRREQVAKQLEAARKRLTDAVKVRGDFATAVRDSARQFASITSIKTAGSPAVLIDEMRNRLDALRTFRGQLAKLTKLGVRGDVYEQIASAGVDAGGATAEALLAGGKAAVAQVNRLQAGIASESAKLGRDSSRKLYQAGVDAAAGLARGLSAKSAMLQQAANRLAASLEAAVKQRLGIRSPSTVFEGIGTSIGEGLAQGIAGMRPVVAAELAALADMRTAPAYRAPRYDMAGTSPAGRGGATYVTTVSGVASPEQVAAVVDRARRTTEFLAGARS